MHWQEQDLSKMSIIYTWDMPTKSNLSQHVSSHEFDSLVVKLNLDMISHRNIHILFGNKIFAKNGVNKWYNLKCFFQKQN